MATQVQFRRGTSAETASFTGANGEVTVDTVKHTCVVHDATQVGVASLGLGQQCQVAPSFDHGRNVRLRTGSPAGLGAGAFGWLGAGIGQADLGADDGFEPSLPRRPPEAHRAVQAIVIGEGQRRIAQRHGPLDQRLGRRGAIKEGVVAMAMELDVGWDRHGLKIYPATRTEPPWREFRRPSRRGR